jgi:hypothetical protein
VNSDETFELLPIHSIYPAEKHKTLPSFNAFDQSNEAILKAFCVRVIIIWAGRCG